MLTLLWMLLLLRAGGGAFEDLIGFSDEGVVRAAADCVTPLVSAIGHEDDWTLIDLAADLRASTPTDAAKRIVPDVCEELSLVSEARTRIFGALHNKVSTEQQRLSAYTQRPNLTHPQSILDKPQQFVKEARTRLNTAMNFMTAEATSTIDKLHATLTALSPQSTLNRGYAVVQKADGTVIDVANALTAGEGISVTLKSGKLNATVNETIMED